MTPALASTSKRAPAGALALVAAALLCGCAAGPDYRRPDLVLPQGYADAQSLADWRARTLTVTADLPQRWWELFRCAPLDDRVRASLAHNPDVAAAQAALRVAQENTRAQRGADWPTVGVGYAGSRQSVAGTLASPVSSNAAVYNLHTAQLTVSYVPDVFGANRRLLESLQAQADSQRWAVEATYLTLSANVVVAAITEAGLRAQLLATRRLVELQQDLVDRFRRLQSLGQYSGLDVAQQEAQLAALQAGLPGLTKQLAQQRDLLLALGGELPDAEPAHEFTLDQLTLPEPLPLTLPSSLVEHRPDVLAAEEQLRAASAQIGVAAANRLPSVTLGVNAWGSSAYSLAALFGGGTGFWTVAGSVGQTLFDGGMLQHRQAAAVAAYDQAAAQYRSTVLHAYQNVADALQSMAADADALQATQRAQDAAQRTFDLTRRQSALGDASPMALMLAEQALQQATVATIQARTSRLSDAAALLQALGGGWWNRPAPADIGAAAAGG